MTATPPLAAVTLPWIDPAAATGPRFVVVDHDTDTVRRLMRLSGPGVVAVVRYATDLPSLEAAAAAVMRGLAKNPVLALSKRWNSPIASGWLAAAGISTAVIVDAADYPVEAQADIVDWLGSLGVSVVFAWMTSELRPDADSLVTAEEMTVEDFWAELTSTEVSEPVEQFTLPRLPRVDGVVFRSTCRELLDPADFEVVDARFVAAVADVFARLDRSNKPRSDATAQVLRTLLDTAVDTEELVLRVRAAQVALLRRGDLINVDMAALLGAAECLPRRGFATSQDWWRRLGDYWDPDTPAAVALFHAGVTSREMPELTVDDVTAAAPDDVTVTKPDGSKVQLVDAPARYVTALLAMRLAAGAAGDKHLFTTHRSEVIRYQFARDRYLAAPALEVGVEVPGRSDETSNSLWLRRYGVTCRAIRRERTDDAA